MVLRILTPAERQRLDDLQLCLNEPEPVLICRPCGYALKPFGERVGRHLVEKHDVPKSKRRGINSLIKSIGLADPNDVPLRPDGLPPHEALLKVRGYACRHCNYRTASLDLVGRHISSVHGFKQSRKADGWQRDHVLGGVLLQSWSQNGSRGCWIAQPPTLTSLFPAVDCGRQADPVLQTNWMRRTGWAETFEGARRDILAATTELPASVGAAATSSTGFHLGRRWTPRPLRRLHTPHNSWSTFCAGEVGRHGLSSGPRRLSAKPLSGHSC
ncbi:hypothetical protein CPLU01_15066 [Colletotrichum plurivorum]|uniref:C2H2-type domain-containing protein n=1 Tax=Colletotrichum plurivorum TaxID=2175906 RepID=A0A8H6JFG5_9PEZI|nr:hypothetical protein CPLU01_15066 [Colletotrichum plurivorum]